MRLISRDATEIEHQQVDELHFTEVVFTPAISIGRITAKLLCSVEAPYHSLGLAPEMMQILKACAALLHQQCNSTLNAMRQNAS